MPFQNNTIYIQPNETTVKAYAVLRDKWGNFICSSNPTNWSLDKPISSVANGNMNFGEVIITRIDSGLTVVHSIDTKTGLQGSANLIIMNYYYKELRVTVKQKGTGKDTLLPIDSLILPFNQDTVLWAIGKRSDNGNWESTTVNWELSKSLAGTVNPVSASYAMIISSRDTGTGWIRITNGNDAVTIPDTIIIKFTQKATKASIDILHEPSRFTCKLNGSTLILSSPRKYVGSAVVISDISGRTVDRFTLDGPKMQRVLGLKNIGAGSGLYIMTVTGKLGRTVVPIKMGY